LVKKIEELFKALQACCLKGLDAQVRIKKSYKELKQVNFKLKI
jgi:hypothetical protein